MEGHGVSSFFQTRTVTASSACNVGMANTKPAGLGEFEVVVLMAVLHLQADGAFGSAVLLDISRRSGRDASRGTEQLTHSVALLARMHKGLEPILGDL